MGLIHSRHGGSWGARGQGPSKNLALEARVYFGPSKIIRLKSQLLELYNIVFINYSLFCSNLTVVQAGVDYLSQGMKYYLVISVYMKIRETNWPLNGLLVSR